jgi:hypothetical protein
MNAAFNGRPVLMHDRDVRQDLMSCFEQQTPTFRLVLEVIKLLDEIIDLYRPTALGSDEFDMPYTSFEELVTKCHAESIRYSAIGT